MIAIMWQFDVKQGREGEFEQLYGVDGEWTAVNRHTRSYLGSSFLRDQNRSSRYIVIEFGARWWYMSGTEHLAVMRSRLLRNGGPRLSNPLSRWESSPRSMCPIAPGRRGLSEAGLRFLPLEPLAVASQISLSGLLRQLAPAGMIRGRAVICCCAARDCMHRVDSW